MYNLNFKNGFIMALLIGSFSSCNNPPIEKNGMVLVKEVFITIRRKVAVST
jgi:hypothetical protein